MTENFEAYENLGRNVRFLREKYRLSRQSLAALLGIGVGSLRRLEQGSVPPRLSFRVLIRLAGIFDVSIDRALLPELEKDLPRQTCGKGREMQKK